MCLPLHPLKYVTIFPSLHAGYNQTYQSHKNIMEDRMTTVKWYLSSIGTSLILLNLSETQQLSHLDSGIVNNIAR